VGIGGAIANKTAEGSDITLFLIHSKGRSTMKHTHMFLATVVMSSIIVCSAILPAQNLPPDDPMLVRRTARDAAVLQLRSSRPAATSLPLGFARNTARDWKKLIDSTWGPGLPTDQKLQIFDGFWDNVNQYFGGFPNLGVNWDSLKALYRPEVAAGVSRGRFAAILSQLSLALREPHTYIRDRGVDSAFYINPNSSYPRRGVPLLCIGGWGQTGFGAALTPLPDSSLLVLKVQSNHPFGLQPGDIVLGYDRVSWKQLIRQLLDAQLPFVSPQSWSLWGASPESWTSQLLTSAAENWHLFDSVDVMKYSTGETLHFPTSKLDVVGWDALFATDQIPVKGAPMTSPGFYSTGTVEGTNVGYIYLHSFNSTVISGLEPLINMMMASSKDGLIIDLRFNLGGYIPTGLGRLFNFDPFTMYSIANRSSTTNRLGFDIASNGISLALRPDIYDRPIAVLTGSMCYSAGDYAAFILRAHPMARSFGRKTLTAYVNGSYLSGYYSSNQFYFQISKGGVFSNFAGEGYMMHKGFEVDESVWFAKDDAAKGDDTVVKKALEWIATVAHGHDVTLAKPSGRPAQDSIKVTAKVENPQKHSLSVWSYLSDAAGSLVDSSRMYDDGLHNDGISADNIWGGGFRPPARENVYGVSLRTSDLTLGTFRNLPNTRRYFTIGPVVCKGWISTTADTIPNPGDVLRLRFNMRNNGKIDTVRSVTMVVSQIDTLLIVGSMNTLAYGDLAPGAESSGTLNQGFKIHAACPPNTKLRMLLIISSQGSQAWTDTVSLVVLAPVTDVATGTQLPTVFSLSQNYPNPFNPSTTIRYDLPKSANVNLKIFNALGQGVASLVNERKEAGYYQSIWNANVPSGIYFYRLQAGEFVETKKMILLR
jgi:hypothetical protein